MRALEDKRLNASNEGRIDLYVANLHLRRHLVDSVFPFAGIRLDAIETRRSITANRTTSRKHRGYCAVVAKPIVAWQPCYLPEESESLRVIDNIICW